MIERVGIFAALAAFAGALPMAAGGDPPQSGNFCVQDFQGGAVCTANDVRFEEFIQVQVIEDCPTGVPGEATIVFQVVVSADGSPDRFDIGMFMALDGGSALTGDDCLHDYLDPPLTDTPVYGDANTNGIPDILNGPWWDEEADVSDVCGDIETDTEVIKTLVPITIDCVDNSVPPDGIVDISACASWDNNQGSTCTGVAGAFPGTPAKCSCTLIETGIPIPVELTGFTVE